MTPMLPRSRTSLALASLLASAATLLGQQNDPAEQPGELGAVRWWRDEAAAKRAAVAANQPLLALFQEVPG